MFPAGCPPPCLAVLESWDVWPSRLRAESQEHQAVMARPVLKLGTLVRVRVGGAEDPHLSPLFFSVCFFRTCGFSSCDHGLWGPVPLDPPGSPSFPVAAVCIHSVSCTLFFNVKLF